MVPDSQDKEGVMFLTCLIISIVALAGATGITVWDWFFHDMMREVYIGLYLVAFLISAFSWVVYFIWWMT